MFGTVVEFITQGGAFVAFITILLLGAVTAMIMVVKNVMKQRDEENQ